MCYPHNGKDIKGREFQMEFGVLVLADRVTALHKYITAGSATHGSWQKAGKSLMIISKTSEGLGAEST